MNKLSIIQEFRDYLKAKESYTGKVYDTSTSASIFLYASEFKTFINEEFGSTSDNFSIFSKSIDEILDMDIVDGKLVEKEENIENNQNNNNEDETILSTLENENEGLSTLNIEQTEESDDKTTLEINPSETLEENTETDENDTLFSDEETKREFQTSDIVEILNALLEDENIIKAFDNNNSGMLDEEEVKAFLEAIKNNDNNESNISLDDIFKGIEDIKEGEETPNTEDVLQERQEAIEEHRAESPRISGGGGGGGSYSPNTQNQPKTLENMTEAELNAELTTAQSTLSEKQNALKAIQNGTDAELVKRQATIDEQYQNFENQTRSVDAELAEKLSAKKQEQDAKQIELNSIEGQIVDENSAISMCNLKVNNAQSLLTTLQNQLTDLRNSDTSQMKDKQKADVQSKISELENNIIPQKNQEYEAAKQELQMHTENLNALNAQKTTKQEELETIKGERATIENEITQKHPELLVYKQAVDTAQNDYDSYKAQAISAIQAEITTAEQRVNEVNQALLNVQTKTAKKEYSPSLLSLYNEEAGEAISRSALEQVNGNTHSYGMCGKGVRIALQNLGYKNITPCKGKEWATVNLEGRSDFVEITSEIESPADFQNLPTGCIVVYGAYVRDGVLQDAGHVEIVCRDKNWNGGEAVGVSDYIRVAGVNTSLPKWGATWRVFMPC